MNCDPIARWYRWLEYAGFGRALERRRTAFLPEMDSARRALVLGDGDGRFLVAALRANPKLQVDALDSSAEMVRLAKKRIKNAAGERVRFDCADAKTYRFPPGVYDLIVTHFFLDCFEDQELAALVPRIAQAGKPAATWIISEFRQPRRGAWAAAAAKLISILYLFFRWTTGLQVRTLPNHAALLRRSGFDLVREETAFGGLLASELWRKAPAKPSKEPQANPGTEQHGIRQDAQQGF